MDKESKRKTEGSSKKTEGISEGLLGDIGNMIPGLGSLLEKVGKSKAIKERLEQIDQEIERKFKEGPIKKSGQNRFNQTNKNWKKDNTSKKYSSQTTSPPKPRQWEADIFDEKDFVKVIAEIPGIAENELDIHLENDKLVIAIKNTTSDYQQKIQLPCSPKGKIEKVCKNGILEVTISKSDSKIN